MSFYRKLESNFHITASHMTNNLYMKYIQYTIHACTLHMYNVYVMTIKFTISTTMFNLT